MTDRRVGSRGLAIFAAIAMTVSPAFSQQFHSKRNATGYPVDTRPKVDEKAYKAALDRIPVPNKKYDPWDLARPSDQASNAKKSN